jgi:hypothetical protein
MAQFHVSKDPSNQLSLTFAYDPLNIKYKKSVKRLLIIDNEVNRI